MPHYFFTNAMAKILRSISSVFSLHFNFAGTRRSSWIYFVERKFTSFLRITESHLSYRASNSLRGNSASASFEAKCKCHTFKMISSCLKPFLTFLVARGKNVFGFVKWTQSKKDTILTFSLSAY